MGNCCCRNGRVWPWARPDYDDNVEAKGYVAISAARGPVVIYGALFAIVAMNAYASSLADCQGDVLGGLLQASSVISTLAVFEGILNSVLSPLFGGFADLTPHRKSALGITFAIVILTLLVQAVFFISSATDTVDPSSEDGSEFLHISIFDNEAAFLILCVVFVTQTVVYELSALLAVSYAPELTPDETKTTGFIADSFAVNNGAQLILVIVLTGLSLALGLNGFQGGMVGGFVTAVWCSSLFAYGFPKMDQRREINPDLDPACYGMKQLFNTFVAGMKKYPDLFKFLISWMLVAAAVSSSVALATTYLQFHLALPAFQIQLLLGGALVMSVPGSVLARVWVTKFGFGVKSVYVVVSLVYGLSFVIAPFILTSSPIDDAGNGTASQFGRCPNPQPGDVVALAADDGVIFFAAFFVLLWGILLGHVYPLNIAIYSQLIPGGEETTWFGIKVTFSKVLTWFPPLVYTAINETGGVRFAIMPLGGMFLAGGFVAYFIDMDAGNEAVKDTLHRRRGAGMKDPNARRDTLAINIDDGKMDSL